MVKENLVVSGNYTISTIFKVILSNAIVKISKKWYVMQNFAKIFEQN